VYDNNIITIINIPVWAGDKDAGGTRNAQVQILDQERPVRAIDRDTHELEILAGLENRRKAPRDGRPDFLSRNFEKSVSLYICYRKPGFDF
jgi:hypothetical protein